MKNLEIKKKINGNQINIIETEKKFISLKILLALFIAFAVSLTLLIGYSLLITYTNVSDKNLNLVTAIVCVISVVMAGFDVAKIFKNKGWFWGMFVGFLYYFVLNIIGLLAFNKILLTQKNFIDFLICLSSGAIGGIVGVNFKK